MKIAVSERRLPPDEWAASAAAAAERGADLLMLPEAAPDAVPELCDGGTATALADLARNTGIAVLGGYVERCITGIYNAALLVDRRGVCIANYRQTHVGAGGVGRFDHGHWLTIMPLDGFRWGILLGHDLMVPEVPRALVLAGCDGIAVLGGASDRQADTYLRVRAQENRCWIARSGPDAGIVDANGETRSARTGNGLLLGDIPPAGDRSARHGERTAGRQPRLYEILAHSQDEEAPRA